MRLGKKKKNNNYNQYPTDRSGANPPVTSDEKRGSVRRNEKTERTENETKMNIDAGQS